jgi:hypothetical protein
VDTSRSVIAFVLRLIFNFSLIGFPGLPASVLNATVLTASGQPIQLTQSGMAGPQKLIVTQQGPGPRLIVPAHQVALLSNGAGPPFSVGPNLSGQTLGNDVKKDSLKDASRKIMAPHLSLFPTSPLTERIETHKIISGSIGMSMSGTPIILQTAMTSLRYECEQTSRKYRICPLISGFFFKFHHLVMLQRPPI